MQLDREEALDRCLAAMQAGESVEEALRSVPYLADELRPLLVLSGDFKSLPDPTSSLHGVMRAMAHVSVAEGRKEHKHGRRHLLVFQPILMRVAASLVFIVVLGWGTTVASSDAAPGDLLYLVKRFTERARFFLTLNSENQAELRIVFSEERLSEALKRHTRGEGIDEGLLISMLEEARLAVAEAGDLPVSERERILARAESASKYQMQVLANIQARATDTERKQLTRWMDRCDARWQWMSGVREESDGTEDDTPAASQSWRENCERNCPMW